MQVSNSPYLAELIVIQLTLHKDVPGLVTRDQPVLGSAPDKDPGELGPVCWS